MKTEQRQKPTTYTCPMHPEVRQNTPGKCPKCAMDLVPQDVDTVQAETAEHIEPRGGHQKQHGRHEMAASEHHEMIRKMRAPWVWTNFTVIALGAWLITSPFTFGYLNPEQVGAGVARITEERGLASVAFRSAAMAWSDVLSGVLLMALGAFSLRPRTHNDFWGRWGVCAVGIWLQFAPLVFWAPTPSAYINDTLVGTFAIAFSILVPMMPGMAHHMAMMKPGPVIPPGWSYNPSSWHQRAPLIALAFIGWFISRNLAAVQLGYIPNAWEPFFGVGSHEVLHSKVSRGFPISDAGFGALAYTIEMVMGFMGSPTRWRSMPWMVTFFGILVIPLGIVHVVLVILQPVAVGFWCTLCLAAAATMLVMIPLTVDEVVAMCQFMLRSVRDGKPFWRTFFVGDTVTGGGPDERTPKYGAAVRQWAPAMIWGVTIPWPLWLSMALGAWLMFAPSVFGSYGVAADSDHLVGALVLMTAAIATAEVVRPLRFVNVLFGAWLIAAPWLLHGFSAAAKWNGIAAGIVLILASLPRGSLRERYGGWDKYIV